MDHISCTYPTLDAALGGGISPGSFTVIQGDRRSTTAMMLAVHETHGAYPAVLMEENLMTDQEILSAAHNLANVQPINNLRCYILQTNPQDTATILNELKKNISSTATTIISIGENRLPYDQEHYADTLFDLVDLDDGGTSFTVLRNINGPTVEEIVVQAADETTAA